MLIDVFVLMMSITTIVLLVNLIRRLSSAVNVLKKSDNIRDTYMQQMSVHVGTFYDEMASQSKEVQSTQADLIARVTDLRTFVEKNQSTFDNFAMSDLRESRYNELRRLNEFKMLYDRFMLITTSSRQVPSTEDILAIESINRRISELTQILNVN